MIVFIVRLWLQTAFLGFYEPPASWKEKMTSTDLQADLNAPNMAIDPITGAPTNIKYPQSISEDIDLVDRKPCQGGVCETYLIKDRCNGNSENCPPLSAMQSDSTPSSSVSTQPTNSYTPQPCCDQMPTPTPCLALACPPPPACNPTCKSRVPGNWPPAFYRRGKITTRRNSDGDKWKLQVVTRKWIGPMYIFLKKYSWNNTRWPLSRAKTKRNDHDCVRGCLR